jgi:DNA-binding MarR family transcriptional regulator
LYIHLYGRQNHLWTPLIGVGTSEYEFLHAVRKNPGITQAGVCERLGLDKAAAARRAANLEAKGFIIRKPNPLDARSRLLFATAKADKLKCSRETMEAGFYEWLFAQMPDDRRAAFCETLDELYQACKAESKAGFPHVSGYVAGRVCESEPAGQETRGE